MKFICTKENLVNGLSKVVPIAGRNVQLPILQNILLKLKEGVLHLTCTDLELGIHTTVPGKVESDGSCTVVARRFMDFIQQLPSDNPITIELQDNNLKIKTSGFQAQFPTTPDDEFPLLPPPPKKNIISVNGINFCQALNQTMFSAAKDNTRPEINCVFIKGNERGITIAATDSFRLVEEKISLQNNSSKFIFLLPLNAAQEVARLFNAQPQINLIPHDNHISFQAEGVELSSRLVEGNYPDYQQIIPKKYNITGKVNKEELIVALKTLSVFLPRDSRRIQVIVKPDKSSITLSASGTDTGAGNVDLQFDGEGEEIEMLFNIQYLLDGIGFIAGDEVMLRLVSSTEPASFTATDKKTKYLYLVMPIQA